jgi:pre-mRNA-splicing factor ISY1
LAELCSDVHEAERWRMQIIKEIGKNVLLIQNQSLEEHKIRDINDLINKLLREKYHWERRIVELGGADRKVSSWLCSLFMFNLIFNIIL